MGNWTPGPWRHHDMESNTVVAGKPGIPVAHTNAKSRPDAENEANARLIASAPALADALRVLYVLSLQCTPRDDPDMQDALEAANSALAKAGIP